MYPNFQKNTQYLKQVNSTNELLGQLLRENALTEGYTIRTDFQTSGKGQMGNFWESDAGKNLLFSILLYPSKIQVEEQFILSQIVSIAIKSVLDRYAEGFSIKWPNDIYYRDKKIAGILIENSIQGGNLKHSIVGVGLNVNQKIFRSDAPNPISLRQIIGRRVARKSILEEIYSAILSMYYVLDKEEIRKLYFQQMYRNMGYYLFEADNFTFEAMIKSVNYDGRLELCTRDNELRSFYFKEVAFCI
jgi:BirA family biotin operon repressor/biotin-[acetyl-CoA-carboxylase] ligase